MPPTEEATTSIPSVAFTISEVALAMDSFPAFLIIRVRWNGLSGINSHDESITLMKFNEAAVKLKLTAALSFSWGLIVALHII